VPLAACPPVRCLRFLTIHWRTSRQWHPKPARSATLNSIIPASSAVFSVCFLAFWVWRVRIETGGLRVARGRAPTYLRCLWESESATRRRPSVRDRAAEAQAVAAKGMGCPIGRRPTSHFDGAFETRWSRRPVQRVGQHICSSGRDWSNSRSTARESAGTARSVREAAAGNTPRPASAGATSVRCLSTGVFRQSVAGWSCRVRAARRVEWLSRPALRAPPRDRGGRFGDVAFVMASRTGHKLDRGWAGSGEGWARCREGHRGDG
jgi:hypothetical protein